jgi:hypothetical protein
MAILRRRVRREAEGLAAGGQLKIRGRLVPVMRIVRPADGVVIVTGGAA